MSVITDFAKGLAQQDGMLSGSLRTKAEPR
ncbi:hypothetical protein HG15A2_36140 [Adhaeretor mobilis]|uniref:Uncharacterized protein n=1 Tax=Adhaeretor mobilis TaxID=1930276 RepID=A0A517MZQ1_9BACT|nr:hypothetical protein HG15A2_36140 [Adhaeretor mobilis]